MKIKSITCKSFAMAKDVSIEVSEQVLLIHGNNSQGKSHTIKAIRAALVGHYEGILKKDYKALVSNGETKGWAKVDICMDRGEGGAYFGIKLPSGAHSQTIFTEDADLDRFNRFIGQSLDPQSFLKMKPEDRKNYLFALMDVSISPNSIALKLKERGCEESKVKSLKLNDVQAAHVAANAKLVEARAGWRHITGEVYGKEKAELWEPEKVVFNEKDLLDGIELLKTQRAELEVLISSKAGMKGSGSLTQLATLKAEAEKEADLKKQLESKKVAFERNKASMDDARAALEALRRSFQRLRPLACVKCGENHQLSDSGDLVAYTGKSQEEIAQDDLKIDEHEKSLIVSEKAYLNSKSECHALNVQLQASVAAREAIKAMGEIKTYSQEEITALDQKISGLRVAITVNENNIKTLEANAKKSLERVAQMGSARAYHLETIDWQKIVDELSPGGVIKAILFNAIKPINDRMAQMTELLKKATATKNPETKEIVALGKWPCPSITDDIDVVATGEGYGSEYETTTPFVLVSESDQWKIQVLLAEAISHFSGNKIMLIDGADILAPKDRGGFFSWARTLTSSGQQDSIVIAATLKDKMEKLPSGMQAVWIENGICKD